MVSSNVLFATSSGDSSNNPTSPPTNPSSTTEATVWCIQIITLRSDKKFERAVISEFQLAIKIYIGYFIGIAINVSMAVMEVHAVYFFKTSLLFIPFICVTSAIFSFKTSCH